MFWSPYELDHFVDIEVNAGLVVEEKTFTYWVSRDSGETY
jgi:hypothetical protein